MKNAKVCSVQAAGDGKQVLEALLVAGFGLAQGTLQEPCAVQWSVGN